MKDERVARNGSVTATAEQRLVELGIQLPKPPEPFGIYAEAVQTGNLLFVTGMLPTENQAPALEVRPLASSLSQVPLQSNRVALRESY